MEERVEIVFINPETNEPYPDMDVSITKADLNELEKQAIKAGLSLEEYVTQMLKEIAEEKLLQQVSP